MQPESQKADRSNAAVVPISVAITTLGRPEALARCLASLAAGSALPAEVVVVDQSRDAGAHPVVEAAEGLPDVLHVAQDAIGLSLGQNTAVARTTHPVVAVLDDDCVADVDWIERVATVLAPEGPVDVVGGRVLPLDDDSGLYAVSSRTSTTPRAFQDRSRPWDVGSGNNFAFRREWFDRVGGCDERLGPGAPGRGAADIDLFYRLLRAGARVRYEPSLLVYHERKTRSGRLARRVPYGFGMGAACLLWLRQRDRLAIRVLGNWLALRLRMLASAARQRRWLGVWEELLVLAGTARGIVYGLRASGSSR
jgi:GT2 family glycosyltransferase